MSETREELFNKFLVRSMEKPYVDAKDPLHEQAVKDVESLKREIDLQDLRRLSPREIMRHAVREQALEEDGKQKAEEDS
jgi:hypothetical protein